MKLNSLVKFIPEEIRTLFFLKIFTTYSFAVLYSSLVLYMTKDAGITSQFATGVMGVFISLNFLLHFFGGYAGGKLLSNRMLLLFGMVMELMGVAILGSYLFLGLGIFLTGSGLYVTSIYGIMIQKYEPNDHRREIASFWVYSGMNLGFFIGHTVGGYFHIIGNYRGLFYSAIFASFASLVLIGANWHKIADKTTELVDISAKSQKMRLAFSLSLIPVVLLLVFCALIYHSQASKLVMLIGGVIFCSTLLLALRQPNQTDKNKVFAFLILVFAALAFWALFFIGPMGLTLFIKQYVNKDMLGMTVPPQWFNNINTIIIVLGGPILAHWFKLKREKGADLSFPFLFSIALLNIGVAYLVLTFGILLSGDSGVVAMIWVILCYVLQTVGELFLSPVGVAMIGNLAPHGKQGLLLGIWAMVSGIASIVSKFLSQMMVGSDLSSKSQTGIQSFNHVFSLIGWSAVMASVLLFLLIPFVKRLMQEDGTLNALIKEELSNAR